jgi:hypothetical protein
MKLLPNWKFILVWTHSVKGIVLGAMFSMLEVVLPLFGNAIPRGLFAALSAVAAAGAFVCRIVAQRDRRQAQTPVECDRRCKRGDDASA